MTKQIYSVSKFSYKNLQVTYSFDIISYKPEQSMCNIVRIFPHKNVAIGLWNFLLEIKILILIDIINFVSHVKVILEEL